MTSRTEMRLICLSVALVSTMALASQAGAYCLEGKLEEQSGQSWATLRKVPVYLYATGTQTTWNDLDIWQVEANIKAAIDAWWEEGQADVRLYWAGRTTSTDDVGRIVIRSTDQCESVCSSGDVACEKTRWTSQHRVGSTLWFRSGASCNIPWTTAAYRGASDPTKVSLRRLLLHELGHALGLDHPNNEPICLGGGQWNINMTWAAMTGGAKPWSDHHVRFDDREGLTVLYGPLARHLEAYYSDDMLTWNIDGVRTRVAPSRPTSGGWGYLDQNLLGLPDIVFAEALKDHAVTGLTEYWPYVNYPGGFTWQPVASTTGPTSTSALVAWNAWGEDNTQGNCNPDGAKIAVTTNMTSWTVLDAVPSSVGICPFGPPMATYDPKTDRYIVFWDSHAHPYVTYDTSGNVIFVADNAGSDLFVAAHTPNIDCGNTGETDNCLIAWDDRTAYGCLTFRHTRVLASGQLAWNPNYTHCYVQERTPAISYREAGGTYRWGLVLKQDASLFSLRKTMSATNWVNPVGVLWDPNNGLMSASLSQRWELFLGFILVPVDYMYTVSLP